MQYRGGTADWTQTTDEYSSAQLRDVGLRAPKDNDGPCPKGCRWLEDEPGEWTPKVGDSVRYRKAAPAGFRGTLGTVREIKSNGYCIDWDAPASIDASTEKAEYLEPAPRVRPDGTLDLPVRKVGIDEWNKITKGYMNAGPTRRQTAFVCVISD